MTVTSGMNDQLNQLYRRYWSSLESLIPKGSGYSHPFFLKVSDGYFHGPKLLIVGQQSRKWQGDFGTYEIPGDPVSRLMDCYAEFDLGKHYKSAYWQESHRLLNLIDPESPRDGFVTSNLIRVDRIGRPDPAFEEEVCRYPLLESEIEILAPDMIVFFTGPNYDTRLVSTFPGLKLGDTPYRGIHEVTHPRLPQGRCFRTYHPRYVRQARLGQYMDWISKALLA